MTTGVLAATTEFGERRSAKDLRVDRSRPPWRAWRTRSRVARCIRFIETYCRVPSGVGAGELIRLHRFQRDSLEELLAAGVRTGGEQIPRGNAKSTLWAAVGLWAVCDMPDSPQVPLVAFNGLQANRTLMRPIRTIVRGAPEIASRVAVYSSSGDQRVWSAWNDGELVPLPADVERLQGLNPTVALIDEAQTLPPEVLSAVMQGAGKRAESLVLAIGTPAPGAHDSALAVLRGEATTGARVTWIEHAADAGCALDDRRQWHKANPALRAGLLHEDVLEVELRLVTEAEFRCYRLGQWVNAVVANWLPIGAWNECPRVAAPPAGAEVVLAVAGTWSSSVAIVGASGDGAVFVAYGTEAATDDELAEVLDTAMQRWQVSAIIVAPRVRPNLVARLASQDVPVEYWPNQQDLEADSCTEWRRAIVEGRMAHDHHELLAAHVSALVGRAARDGSLRLVAPDDGQAVDAAKAARMAWWWASHHVDDIGEAPAIF